MPVSSYGHTPRAHVDPICSAADAMSVFSIQMTRPLCAETLVMFIDSGGCGSGLVTVSGTTEPLSMIEVAESMALSASGNAHIAGLVIVSVRPGGASLPDDDQLWFEADDLVDDVGLILYDWLIVGRNGCTSISDELGLPSRWPAG